ncbi:MAG: chemotaxis protein [Alphaproteobacteria bacterium]
MAEIRPAGSLQNRDTSGSTARNAQIESAAIRLLAHCFEAFVTYQELGQLAEDLRILSLNAELAAGRAGDRGRAVRALTQYTRALVNRLDAVQTEVFAIRGETYRANAATLRELGRLRSLNRAVVAMGRRSSAGDEMTEDRVGNAREAVLAAQKGAMARVGEALRDLTRGVQVLSEHTTQVMEVVSQSGSITTNIAIEAASAGQYEVEFRTVADTMRRYVLMLRGIVDKTGAAVRSATQNSDTLHRLVSGAVY